MDERQSALHQPGPDLSPLQPRHGDVLNGLCISGAFRFGASSHDEVVHGKGSLIEKMPGDAWQKFANVRMFLAWMWAHPGKKLIFQGIEFGQWKEWNHNQSLDWHLTQSPMHDGLRRLVQHLNWLYAHEPAYYELDDTYEGFEWIDFNDSDNSVWSFMRKGRNQTLVFAVNATPVVREATGWESTRPAFTRKS